MIEFHVPELQDQHWVESVLSEAENECCEYSFVNLLVWSIPYELKIAQVGGRVTGHLTRGKGPAYLYPVGSGDPRPIIDELRADAAFRGEPFRLLCISRQGAEELGGLYPGQFQMREDRDGFDYIYDIQRLSDLEGKRLHAKRNHIHRFVEAFPNWRVEPLTVENLPECLAMDEEWNEQNRGYAGDDSLTDENLALHVALAHFAPLGLEGLLLRGEDTVLGFTAGRAMNRHTYDVHFEKAFGNVQGAYAILNREFARWVRLRHPEIRWLNREDDMGVEGLRKAKQSYYPDRMVEKYLADWVE